MIIEYSEEVYYKGRKCSYEVINFENRLVRAWVKRGRIIKFDCPQQLSKEERKTFFKERKALFLKEKTSAQTQQHLP